MIIWHWVCSPLSLAITPRPFQKGGLWLLWQYHFILSVHIFFPLCFYHTFSVILPAFYVIFFFFFLHLALSPNWGKGKGKIKLQGSPLSSLPSLWGVNRNCCSRAWSFGARSSYSKLCQLLTQITKWEPSAMSHKAMDPSYTFNRKLLLFFFLLVLLRLLI